MLTDEEDARMEEEHAISRRVLKILKLRPMRYSYPKIDNPDECYPDHTKTYKMPMSICVGEFLDGLTIRSNLDEALKRTALEGTCEFKWPVGTYYGGNRHMHVRVTNPTWADVFRLANEAFLDGRNVDHSFLECVRKDSKDGTVHFFFGS